MWTISFKTLFQNKSENPGNRIHARGFYFFSWISSYAFYHQNLFIFLKSIFFKTAWLASNDSVFLQNFPGPNALPLRKASRIQWCRGKSLCVWGFLGCGFELDRSSSFLLAVLLGLLLFSFCFVCLLVCFFCRPLPLASRGSAAHVFLVFYEPLRYQHWGPDLPNKLKKKVWTKTRASRAWISWKSLWQFGIVYRLSSRIHRLGFSKSNNHFELPCFVGIHA